MKQINDILKAALALRAAKMGYTVRESTNDNYLFDIEKGGSPICSMLHDGHLVFSQNTEYLHEIHTLNDTLGSLHEVFALFDRAKPMPFEDVGDYRLLAEFNNNVLAARLSANGEMHFVTWQYDYDHNGVMWGNYFDANYEAAKQDFALRSELIPKTRIFSAEELVALHDACTFRGKNDEEISSGDEAKLRGVMGKIERNIPNLIFDEQGQDNEQSVER